MATQTLDSLDSRLLDSDNVRSLPVPRCTLLQLAEWTANDLPLGIPSFRVVDSANNDRLLVQFIPVDSSNLEIRNEVESQLLLWNSIHGPVTRLRYADLSCDRPYVAFDDITDIDLESLSQPEGTHLFHASQLLKHVNKSIRSRLYHGCINRTLIRTVPNSKRELFLNYLDRFFLKQKLGEKQTVFELYRCDVVEALNLASDLSLRSLQSETIRDYISSREQAMLKRLCKDSFTQDNFDDVFERWLDFFESHVDSIRENVIPAHVPSENDTQAGVGLPSIHESASDTSIGDMSKNVVYASSSLVGKQLDRFYLKRLIGAGGMGAVYEGIDPNTHTPVAIKVLQTQGPNAAQAIKRFNKESRILASIRNEHVTQLYEIGECSGIHFIVMELVSGIDLKKWLGQRGILGEAIALRIVRDIAKALVEAHERGIVHRDIKPENVLLAIKAKSDIGSSWQTDAEFTVKLTDFGIARQIQQSQSMELTRQGGILGTPKYMSPEQCKGGKGIGAATDVYSLGITLYELLAGQVPFDDADMMKLAAMHCFEPAPDIQKRNQSVSQATRELLWKMLAKDPEKRPANASQLVDEISRILDGEPNAFELHPLIPRSDSKKVWERVFEWDLKSAPELLWPHVANTDRLNRAAGLPPISYRTVKDPERGIRRFGSFRLSGITIEWEEHPFEWIEGQRMGVLREFTSGPFKWFMNTVELKPKPDGGTHLVHRVKIEPRNSLGRIVSTVEAGWKGGRALDRVYRKIDETLSASASLDASIPATDVFNEKFELPRNRKSRVNSRIESMQEMGASIDLSHRLADYLCSAPMQEVSKIRPYKLAEKLGIAMDAMLDTLLIASGCGMLEIQWDVICPTCRVAAQSQSLLSEVQQHTTCESCDTQFQSNKANAIELTFRVHAEVRETSQEKYCIGGPWHAPHVVAQLRLAPDERMSIPLRLDAGDYLVRWLGNTNPQVLFVRPSATSTRWDLVLRKNSIPEQASSLRAGQLTFSFKNEWDRELSVRIERMNDRSSVITAATVFGLQRFRNLFPEQTFSNEVPVTTENLTLLEIQLFGVEELYEALGEQNAYETCNAIISEQATLINSNKGVIAKKRDDGLIACFLDCVDACRAAITIEKHFLVIKHRYLPHTISSLPDAQSLRIGVGVHRGRTLLAIQNGIVDYFGNTMRQTSAIAQHSDGAVSLSDKIATDPLVRELLQEQGITSLLTKISTGRETPLIVGRITLS